MKVDLVVARRMTQENEQIRAEIEERHLVDSPTVEKQYDYETGAEQGLDEMLQVTSTSTIK